MIFDITISPAADMDIKKLKKNEPLSYKKVVKLIEELSIHPTTGTGHPKLLSGNKSGEWSRRISKKHRLVYQIKENEILVLVLSAWGHYDDK